MGLSDYSFTSYDIPRDALAGPTSSAFEKFVTDLFVYSGRDGLTVKDLSPRELELAKTLARRNLHFGKSIATRYLRMSSRDGRKR